jgi:hypothetical protein
LAVADVGVRVIVGRGAGILADESGIDERDSRQRPGGGLSVEFGDRAEMFRYLSPNKARNGASEK